MNSPPPRLARLLHATTRFPRLGRVSKNGHVAIYTLTRGRIMGRWFGMPVLVLQTTGRRSAKRRRTTMTYLEDEGQIVVIPINAGSDKVPAWWLNLKDSGSASALIRGKRTAVQPKLAQGEERARLWARYAEQAPSIEAFRAYAHREIPVVILQPDENTAPEPPVAGAG